MSRQAWSRPIGNVVIGSGLALIAQLRFATSFRRSAIAAFVQFLRRLVVPFRASAYWTDRDRIAPHAQTPAGSATCLFATLYPFPRRLGGTADYGNEWRLENTCLALPRCIALAIRLRIPKLYNLRADPYEFADVTSNSYWDWYIYHGYMILAAQRIAGAFADTFKEFPAIQRANSFTIDDALRAMSEAASGGKQ